MLYYAKLYYAMLVLMLCHAYAMLCSAISYAAAGVDILADGKDDRPS